MTDFIYYSGNQLQVVYVDPTISSGTMDGTSMVDAIPQLPTQPSMSGNCMYLVRRAMIPTIAHKGNCDKDNIIVVGMPATSGQLFFTDLPAPVRDTWGVDAAPTSTIFISGSGPNTPWRFGISSSNGGYGLFNLNILSDGLTNQSYGVVNIYGSGATVDSCFINISGQPTSINISGQQISGNPTLGLTRWQGLHVDTGEGLTINNCDIIGYGSGDTYYSPNNYTLASALFIENYSPNQISNCSISNSTFRSVTSGDSYRRNYGIYANGWFENSRFSNLKFYWNNTGGIRNHYTHMRIGGISNGCLVENISGWALPNDNQNYINYGIDIGNGTLIDSSSEGYRRVSQHTFRNIFFYDGCFNYSSFSGFALGSNFNDCTIDGITLIAPSAGNHNGASTMSIGDFSTHNKFNNIKIECGGAVNQPIANNNNYYGIFIGGNNSNQGYGKNYLTNSDISCGKIAIYSNGSLDISNTSITGSLFVSGDSVDITRLEVPISAARYSAPVNIIHHRGPSDNDSGFRATNNVIRIGEFVNKSGIGFNIDYGSALVSVESMSAAGTLNTITSPNYAQNSGKLYLNNYPQAGYWMSQNIWHRLETSVVQFTTSTGYNSGFSLSYTYLTNTNFPAATGPNEQALVVSPPPYKGNEVSSTQLLAPQRQYSATLYFATKYAPAINTNELWFELEIPSGSTGTEMRTISSRGKRNGVEIDTSGTVWVGESPLSIFKVTVPFILDRAESVYSRIYWNKSMAGGTARAFIAPKIVVE
jgi:hypothetical protein